MVPPRYWALAAAAVRRTARARKGTRARMVRPPWGKTREKAPGLLARLQAPVQQLLPTLFDVRRVTDVAIDERPIRAQDERRGDAHGGQRPGVFRRRVVHGQRDVELLEERGDALAVGVHVDGHDHEVPIAV